MSVFISYSSKEYGNAYALKQVLEANGISCWMAPQSIPSGSDYTREIPKAIQSCDIFLLVLSEASQISRWVPKELEKAINEGKIIIPFHTDESSLTDSFNFMLSNVQRIEAFSGLSDAYELLIAQIKSLDGERKSFLKGNICPISFNAIPGDDYIRAKEADPNLAYRKGPIVVKGNDAYWILTDVINMCPDENAVAENVRLSISINRRSPKEIIVESVIHCQNAEPEEVKQSILFISEGPFDLKYHENSAYLYSEYYGLYGSRGMQLTDDILSDNGTILGFWNIDGRIPGGMNNSVTVSIKVHAHLRQFG